MEGKINYNKLSIQTLLLFKLYLFQNVLCYTATNFLLYVKMTQKQIAQ